MLREGGKNRLEMERKRKSRRIDTKRKKLPDVEKKEIRRGKLGRQKGMPHDNLGIITEQVIIGMK